MRIRDASAERGDDEARGGDPRGQRGGGGASGSNSPRKGRGPRRASPRLYAGFGTGENPETREPRRSSGDCDLELETDREDLESLGRLASRNRTKVIVSHHFVQAAEAHRVSEALESCTALGDLAKVAVPVPEFEDAIQLVDLARTWRGRPHPFVLIGMGVGGMVTRALADVLGQEIQYASWGLPATIGQLSLGTATRLRGREPMILGVIGHPIEHSISPTIHEAALAVLGLPAVYLPFDLPPDALDGFFLAAERLRVRGFNVTTPHKETVARSVDELDGDAERLGVVNTVVLRDGWTTGHNTDVYGFRMSLRSLGLRVGDRKALVVGAGGAAKAVVDVLLR